MTIKLDLGAGGKRRPGFLTVDLVANWSGVAPDVAADVTGPLPFGDAYADEIHAYHLLEHIHRWKAEDALREWIRVLKPGGLLVLEMPCLDKIVSIMVQSVASRVPMSAQMTIWGLYGDPSYKIEAQVHKWCYSWQELEDLLASIGLTNIKREIPTTHQPVRDMRMTAIKPGLYRNIENDSNI